MKAKIMEKTVVTGIVLQTAPIGEYDKRLVLLTKEYGKISAFARGARKPYSLLTAAAQPFVFGQFDIYEGRSSFSISGFHAHDYFRELANDTKTACYGFYLLEISDYYAKEYADERMLLALLYQSLKALCKSNISNKLVRRVFELRCMSISGELPQYKNMNIKEEQLLYTISYIINTPIEKLYTFKLTDELLNQLSQVCEYYRKRLIDKQLKSLDILEAFE